MRVRDEKWDRKYIKIDVDKLRKSTVPRRSTGYEFRFSKNNFSEPSKILRTYLNEGSRTIAHKIFRVSFIAVETRVPASYQDHPKLRVPYVLPVKQGRAGLSAPVFKYPPKRVRTNKYCVPRGILKVCSTSSL